MMVFQVEGDPKPQGVEEHPRLREVEEVPQQGKGEKPILHGPDES